MQHTMFQDMQMPKEETEDCDSSSQGGEVVESLDTSLVGEEEHREEEPGRIKSEGMWSLNGNIP